MLSLLQQKRLSYKPLLPPLLEDLTAVSLEPDGPANLPEKICKIFIKTHALQKHTVKRGGRADARKLTVGALFSGGQAPGGHNVLAGLFDGIMQIDPHSHLIGFIDGAGGLIENNHMTLDAAAIDSVRNQGGFDLIGSSRIKIETQEQFEAVEKSVRENGLDALVIIGGDDSNTNAAFLAEFFAQKELPVSVIGVPKTIDADLRSVEMEISFGFDSACKVYAEMIGNIERDALSSKKYYHFIKLMGRSASHIALECALATCPNLTLISEEKRSLPQIITEIADMIEARKKIGKNYGVILLPEGLIEFIPEIKDLIVFLNQILSKETDPEEAAKQLGEEQKALFFSLPEKIQRQLLFERDPHGNVQVSKIETELLLIELVDKELQKRNLKFNPIHHSFGYEGRACLPSNFDANYCYALGKFAALVARERVTGVILAMRNFRRPIAEWELKAIPIVSLMDFEMRAGKEKLVIAKVLVDLKSPAFLRLDQARESWKVGDAYQMPGPMQFFGDAEITDSVPLTL
jgi:pyrophosphate--fructose-6-phosphate 1-phosphotransferase